MILTGKTLEDFNLWLLENGNIFEYKNFHELSDNLKNALIIEFFDSVGIWGSVVCDMLILDIRFFSKESWSFTIKELIIIANEIYNDK